VQALGRQDMSLDEPIQGSVGNFVCGGRLILFRPWFG
jgi:hypothetical protein